jgi:O-antigen ligase
MNKFIIGFLFAILTSRFFAESLHLIPKGADLVDIPVIPILALIAASRSMPRGTDMATHGQISRLVGAIVAVSLASALLNFERTFVGPVALFLFGILEGPILFLSLNKLIRDKRKFADQLSRFIWIMVLVESAAVIFYGLPIFLVTHDPDKISGTFGKNPYQFSALLIMMGGYFLGRQRFSTKSVWYGIGIQCAIFVTFILLQYRSAVPAFFLTYGIIAVLLYGKQIMKMVATVSIFALFAYYGFIWVSESDFNLKYEDLLDIVENPEQMLEYGKTKSYLMTLQMWSDNPLVVPIGAGPGTYVSRANYTFTQELWNADQGVGGIIIAVFGYKDYFTDVQKKYMWDILMMASVKGSAQPNNPNSSLLSVTAEIGIIGAIIVGMLYGTVIRRALKYLRYALARRDPMLPLASGLVTSSIYLIFITPLDNYFEVARVTLPMWTLFWVVTTLYNLSKQERMIEMYNEYYQQTVLQHHEPEPVAVLQR